MSSTLRIAFNFLTLAAFTVTDNNAAYANNSQPAQQIETSRPDSASPKVAVRYDTPSTFPVPRFVSLKSNEVNCRIGPSLQHPTRFVFKHAGAPLLVIAESVDNWRKVRDIDGDTCWVFAKTVRAQTHLISLEATDIYAKPSSDSEVRAHIQPRALVKLVRITDGWAFVEADGVRGWGLAPRFWGVDAVAAATTGASVD